MKRYAASFIAQGDDIDELGHVNNAVWVRWVQEIAVAHWRAVAPPAVDAAFLWVITRHEIDYRGNIGVGDTALAETWVGDAPRGARFDRHVRFTDAGARVLVETSTSWAMVDRARGRLVRVPASIVALFAG